MTDPNDYDSMSRSIKGDPEFEKILEEYKKVIRELKLRCIEKWGIRAEKWFGI